MSSIPPGNRSLIEPPILVLFLGNPLDCGDDLRRMLEESAVPPGERLRWEVSDRLESTLGRLAAGGVDVVLLDVTHPETGGLEGLDRLRERGPGTPVVVLTEDHDEAAGIAAMHRGARDYLVRNEVSLPLLRRVLLHAVERDRVERDLVQRVRLGDLVANVGLSLLRSGPLPAVLGACAEEIGRVLGAEWVCIWTLDVEGRTLDLQAQWRPNRIGTKSGSGNGGGPPTREPIDPNPSGPTVTVHRMVLEDRTIGVVKLATFRPLPEPDRAALALVADGLAQFVERRWALDQLRAKESRLRFLFDRLPGILWTTDTRLRFTSSYGADLIRLTDDPLQPPDSITLYQYFQTDDPEYLPISAHRRALEGQAVSYVLEWQGRTYQSHVGPLANPEGQRVGCIGLALDITPLTEAERALQLTQEEIRIAGEIQNLFYPREAPALAGFEIHGASIPAQAAGGDYFDYLEPPGGGLLVGIGDVSGHGVGPALLMASTRAYLRAFAADHADLGTILTDLNRVLRDDVGEERFVTMVLARLEPEAGRLIYLGAGHTLGYVLDRSGAVRETLRSTALPLGLAPHEEFTPEAPLMLEPGDLILLMTDGISEALSPSQEPFGLDRVLETVRTHRADPARLLIETLLQAVHDFTGGAEQLDDYTAVILKYEPGPPSAEIREGDDK